MHQSRVAAIHVRGYRGVQVVELRLGDLVGVRGRRHTTPAIQKGANHQRCADENCQKESSVRHKLLLNADL